MPKGPPGRRSFALPVTTATFPGAGLCDMPANRYEQLLVHRTGPGQSQMEGCALSPEAKTPVSQRSGTVQADLTRLSYSGGSDGSEQAKRDMGT
jgi:hypothetical protein